MIGMLLDRLIGELCGPPGIAESATATEPGLHGLATVVDPDPLYVEGYECACGLMRQNCCCGQIPGTIGFPRILHYVGRLAPRSDLKDS